LPDAPARAHLFKVTLGNTPHNLTDEDFKYLGDESENMSGSDISVVVNEAMMEPVRKCQTAVKFKEVNGFLYPTFPSDPAGKTMSLMDIDPTKLKAPDICLDDFMAALTKAKGSVSVADLEA
jgi:vacuolar protein-sorting-associated protein 4